MSLCRKPFYQGSISFGCGQCFPCRWNKQRLWAHRIMLETRKHTENLFITLTYKPENLPKGGTLEPRHTTNFLKKLRKRIDPFRIRYFLCGEYGDQTQRPHYHAAIFGIGRGLSDVIEDSWDMGFVHVGDLTLDSAKYLAGYVTKKLTNPKNDYVREFLNGRHPEFARMSLKPGIGADAMSDVARSLLSPYGAKLIEETGDVPMALRAGQSNLPLGRYLRSKLREAYGFEETGAQKGWAMQMSQKACAEYEEKLSKAKDKDRKGFSELMFDSSSQKVRNMESRAKLKRKDIL